MITLWRGLQVLALILGCLGLFIYFRSFHFHGLDDPLYDLIIIKVDDPVHLALFRSKTDSDFIQPTRIQIKSLIELRKESRKGRVTPEDYARRSKDISLSLKKLLYRAKLRRIPKLYAKKYHGVLRGIANAYRSARALDEALTVETDLDKSQAIKDSIKWSKSAEHQLSLARRFFATTFPLMTE